MAISELISLIRQGSIQGSKSTALTPLLIAIGIMATAVVGGAKAGLPVWVIGLLAGCLVILVLGLIGAYGCLLVKNVDALRIERFTLTKMAIEHHLTGDDLTGITEAIQVIGGDGGSSARSAVLPTPGSEPQKLPGKRKQKAPEGLEP